MSSKFPDYVISCDYDVMELMDKYEKFILTL